MTWMSMFREWVYSPVEKLFNMGLLGLVMGAIIVFLFILAVMHLMK